MKECISRSHNNVQNLKFLCTCSFWWYQSSHRSWLKLLVATRRSSNRSRPPRNAACHVKRSRIGVTTYVNLSHTETVRDLRCSRRVPGNDEGARNAYNWERHAVNVSKHAAAWELRESMVAIACVYGETFLVARCGKVEGKTQGNFLLLPGKEISPVHECGSFLTKVIREDLLRADPPLIAYFVRISSTKGWSLISIWNRKKGAHFY